MGDIYAPLNNFALPICRQNDYEVILAPYIYF